MEQLQLWLELLDLEQVGLDLLCLLVGLLDLWVDLLDLLARWWNCTTMVRGIATSSRE